MFFFCFLAFFYFTTLIFILGPHQENVRLVFGCLWGLWKDLKTPKTQRPWVFGEQGTLSRGDMEGLSKKQSVFQGHAGDFVKNVFIPMFRSLGFF
jgi:hypothetical protein